MPAKHHPDFPKNGSTDTVLQSNDGILFHVARTDLIRASTVFSDLFEIGQANQTETPVYVTETSLQLEILLKLMALRAAPLDKLTTLDQASELWTIAAEKYIMPGVAQVLQLVIRGLVPKETRPLTRYIHAKLSGLDDLATEAMEACCTLRLDIVLNTLPAAHVSPVLAVMIERDRRIRHFMFRIRVRGGIRGSPKPLVDGYCACSDHGEQHTVSTEVLSRFREFALDIAAKYSSTPSVVTALESDILRRELQGIYALRCQTSGSAAYPVHRVRQWLLQVEGND